VMGFFAWATTHSVLPRVHCYVFLYLMLQCVSLFLAVPAVLPCGAAKLRGGAKMSVNVDYTVNFGAVFLS